MPPNDTVMEKIYYDDSSTKVTNVRVTCKHLTIPVSKIEAVGMNYRAENFFIGLTCFVFSLSLFLFLPDIQSGSQLPYAIIFLIFVIASAAYTYLVYFKYIELEITAGGRKVALMTGSMLKRRLFSEICSHIGTAILDEKKYQDMKTSGTLEATPTFNASETVRIKLMLEDYEKLKKLREEFISGQKAEQKK